MGRHVDLTIEEGVARLEFARPKALNSFNPEMAEDLEKAFNKILGDESVRLVLILGQGPAFMVGGDIQYFHSKLDEMRNLSPSVIARLNNVIVQMTNLPQAVLAVVHGSVAGVGMSFMMAADLVIAEEKTVFTLAYSNIGISPDGGASYFLPRIVGEKKAMEIALLSERFDAEQAKDWGLVNWTAPVEELDARVENLVKRLKKGPKHAFSHIKRLLRQSWDRSLEEQLEDEAVAFVDSCGTKEFKEGVTAFLEKRAPNFAKKDLKAADTR